jgi:3-oxoacyl-[acyl-carrier-protein] synthase II
MRTPPSVAVTGIGVVAPNGIGKEAFWDNCLAGVSGIRPITLFDASPYRCQRAGEISAFVPEDHLGPKGLRTLDRTTRLALVAAKLAIEDARLPVTEQTSRQIGVVLGSTMGSLRSISEFDLQGLREGARYVNPALFPNVVMNSPASQIAIRFGLRGLNATVSTGFTAGLDAIGYAVDLLRLGRACAMLVGGVEELCLQTFLGFYRLGLLAATTEGPGAGYAPWDARRGGTLLGEGAAMLVLEPLEDARARRATVYATVAGYGAAFHPDSMYRHDPLATAGIAALREALESAEATVDEIDYIAAGANSTAIDAMEAVAVREVFRPRTEPAPISAVKSMLGESFSAGAALQTAAALGAICRQQLPPTVGWEAGTADGAEGLGVVVDTARAARVDTVLVPSIGMTGTSSAVVLQRSGGE